MTWNTVLSRFNVPPYTDGGGGSVGEQPTVSVVEYYVTPFDRFVWNDQDESEISDR